MQYARDANKVRTNIQNAMKGVIYYCPYCDAPLVQRHGQVNIPHFAHKPGCLCTDTWHHEMSEWHIRWQNKFPEENREVSVVNELGRHRADILVNNTVIEFQHSPMSVAEFQERNAFYTACGYQVVWLFDARDAWETGRLKKTGDNEYWWTYAPKTIAGLDLNGKVSVFLQLQDSSEDNTEMIIRVTKMWYDDLSYFESVLEAHYTEDEFIELTHAGHIESIGVFYKTEKQCVEETHERNDQGEDADLASSAAAGRDNNKYTKNDLTHTLHLIRRPNDELEYYGCPLSEDNYAPQLRTGNGTDCATCPYCIDNDIENDTIECAGRFREYLDDIDKVLSLKSTYTTTTCSYQAKDGSIKEISVDNPKSPGTTLLRLELLYAPGVMIVKNIKTGYVFKITRSVSEMLKKYRRAYGCFRRRNGDWSDSREIYGSWDPDWIVIWFKRSEEMEQYKDIMRKVRAQYGKA